MKKLNINILICYTIYSILFISCDSNSSDKISIYENCICDNSFSDFLEKDKEILCALCSEDLVYLDKIDKEVINDIRDKKGNNVFSFVIKNEKWKSFEKLIEIGLDINLENNLGETPVHLSVLKSDSNYLKLLYENGGDINYLSDKTIGFTSTPLMFAIRFACFNNILFLLDHRVDVNKRTELESPVLISTSIGSSKIYKLLIIDHNCNISNEDAANIVFNLRYETDSINSYDYKLKMQVVKYLLDEKGVSYWEEPVPDQFYNLYDSLYLEKY